MERTADGDRQLRRRKKGGKQTKADRQTDRDRVSRAGEGWEPGEITTEINN